MNKPNRLIMLLALGLATALTTLASEPANYYGSAYGKSDKNLMAALCNIIREHNEVSYSSGLLNAFAKADTDEQGYIIDIYSDCRYRPSDNGASASAVGQGYNREHSFPRSWFGGEVAPMNTDVFHIYPTDIFVNSKRGNLPYGVCKNGTTWSNGNYHAKGKSGNCTYPGYSGLVFEPDDEYKGDLARTYFYMATCYMNELPSWPGCPQLDYQTNNYKAFSTWTINMLMEWTRMDPVSEKEIKRNDVVYGIQNNRNPFIDHPELAEYIWGDKQGEAWGAGSPQPEITAPQNGLVFDMGTCIVGEQREYNIYLEGKNLTEDLTLTMSDSDNFSVDADTFTASIINNGTMLTVTFKPLGEGTFKNQMTLSSSEASTSFSVTAIAQKEEGPNPPVVSGDSIVEDWEGCDTYASYTDKDVQGHAFTWQFTNAGIFKGDNLSIGEYSCRLGKTSNSEIAMTEDYERGTSGISFWAGCFGNDTDATLDVDYSIDHGSTWTTLATITTTKGTLQRFMLDTDISEPIRYRIAQKAGARVNIDDITIYALVKELTGDVNADGEVNIADVNAIIGIILGKTTDESTAKRADVNNDEEINIADVNFIINLILG